VEHSPARWPILSGMRFHPRRSAIVTAVHTGLGPLVLALVAIAACSPTTPNQPPPSIVSLPPSPAPSTGSPAVSGSATLPPGASAAIASGATGAGACGSAGVQATGSTWGGAAGSRGSDIIVRNTGASACLMTANPVVVAIDPGGAVLLQSQPRQAGVGPSVAAGAATGFSVQLSNWCNQSVRLPIHFALVLPEGSVEIGQLAVSSVDELPPCNGPGQPALLSTSNWQAR
jgi:hypothetical protein